MKPLDVSILAIPDAVISTMTGILDVMNSFKMLAGLDDAIPESPPFRVRIAAETLDAVQLASGIPILPQVALDEVHHSHLIIVPSVLVGPCGWTTGRYPRAIDWLKRQHAQGAVLCSACSGIFLLAETHLWDGREATVHFEYRAAFSAVYPEIRLKPEEVLVVSGDNEELVTSGASNTWHDLVLYLAARYASPAAAQSIARFFALQWHRDGLAPYMRFTPRRDHGDAAIAEAQDWIADNYQIASPVEEMMRRSGLSERTFKRRFAAATGFAPISYVQRLRVEEAKRRLERTASSVESIGWEVGYEDPSAFRRVFARIAGVTPARYRRQFQVPCYD
jgi:transcriptional regulator GlxA family with amidase domain